MVWSRLSRSRLWNKAILQLWINDGARKGVDFWAIRGQLSKITVDVVGIATLGFELNRQMLDTELCCDAAPDKLQQLKTYV